MSRIFVHWFVIFSIIGLMLAACQPIGITPGTSTPIAQEASPTIVVSSTTTSLPTLPSQPTLTLKPSATLPPTQTPQPTPIIATSTPEDPTIDCMGTKPGDKLDITYEWYGQEDEKIKTVLQPLNTACGIQLIENSIKDPGHIGWQLTLKPDIMISSSPQVFTLYSGNFKDLTALGAHAENYPHYWIDLGSSKGRWFTIPLSVDIKSLIWYSPERFKALGYEVPSTFDELNNLVEKMAQDKNIPWSMGLENGTSSGEKGIEFSQDILLAQKGSQYLWDIISRKIYYDDKDVMPAFQLYQKWATDPAYAVGGAYGTQHTYYLDAIDKVFSDKPTAMMLEAPGSAVIEIAKYYPNFTYGTDYDFFPFPGFNKQGVQIDADYMMALTDTPAVHAALAYLTGAAGVKEWLKAGIGGSPNNLAAGKSSNPIFNAEAAVLMETTAFTPSFHQAMFAEGSLAGQSFFDLMNNAIIYILQGATPQKALDAILEDELEEPGE